MMRQVKIKKFLFENLKWTAQFIFLFLFFVCFLFALNIKTPFVNVSVKGVVPGKEFSLKKNGYPALRIYNKGQETVKVKISGKVERLKSEKEDNPLLNLPPKRGKKQRGDFALSTKRNVAGELLFANIIKIEKPVLEIEPGSFAETDIIIFVPRKKENYGRVFKAKIFINSAGTGQISAGPVSYTHLTLPTN